MVIGLRGCGFNAWLKIIVFLYPFKRCYMCFYIILLVQIRTKPLKIFRIRILEGSLFFQGSFFFGRFFLAEGLVNLLEDVVEGGGALVVRLAPLPTFSFVNWHGGRRGWGRTAVAGPNIQTHHTLGG